MRFESVDPLIDILALIKKSNKHRPHLFRCCLGKSRNHSRREVIHGSQQIVSLCKRTSEHIGKISRVHIPIVLKALHCFPFILFIAPLCGNEVLLVSNKHICKFRLVKHIITSISSFLRPIIGQISSLCHYKLYCLFLLIRRITVFLKNASNNNH